MQNKNLPLNSNCLFSLRMSEKKVEKVMKEFKKGELHSGSKEGPKVKDRKQAVAIALSEARNQKKKGKAK